MATKLSKEERIQKYRAAVRFQTVSDMLEALGLKDSQYNYNISDGNYGELGWRVGSISVHGYVLVEYIQNREQECIVTILYKVAPQFFYDVTPRSPYFDTDKNKWMAGPNPEIKFLKSKTNRYQILDLRSHGIHHVFDENSDSAGECFDVVKRTKESIIRFKRSVPAMMLWLNLPKNTNSKDWHKARRTLYEGTIESAMQRLLNLVCRNPYEHSR